MQFDPQRVAFGRHETFPLRFAWLPKGFQAMQANPRIFEEDEAIVTLGVGKNMVRSIRYWLIATQLAQPGEVGLESTALGLSLLAEDGWDPYLEDETTIWLLHWLLVTNPAWATVNTWFFNQFHKPRFTGQEAQTSFVDWCRENVKSRFAAGTAKKDVAVLLRAYVRARSTGAIPIEETLDSPLSLLGLISYATGEKAYRSHLDARPDVSNAVLAFATAQLVNSRGEASVPIEQLMYPSDGWPSLGTTFRLTENELITRLEQFARDSNSGFEVRETAGIHQLYRLKDVDPIVFLGNHYSQEERVAA